MKRKKNNPKMSLSDSDIVAILYALETIDAFPCETPEQKLVNILCRDAAAAKLESKERRFSANEIRIISCAIDGVILYLSGQYPEVTLDPELHNIVSKNLFVYNKLSPYYRDLMYLAGKEYLLGD